MSLKRVVLLAVLAVLVAPTMAFADGVNFGFVGSHLWMARPHNLTTIATNVKANVPNTVPAWQRNMVGPASLYYVSKFAGPVPPGSQVPPTFGGPYGVFPTAFNFGTVSFTTGPAVSYVLSGINPNQGSVTFAAGGAVSIVSNAAFAAATSGAIPAGTVLFSGVFSGTTTMTQITFPTQTCLSHPTCAANFNYVYNLQGPVQGNVAPILMALLNIPAHNPNNGFLFTVNYGFNGPNDPIGNPEGGIASVVVPEPGTLALFGTGLMGLAGLLRRRLKA